MMLILNVFLLLAGAYAHGAGYGSHTQAFLQHEGHLAQVPTADTADVFPVPTASRCIVIIICQYMLIVTALAVCRTYQELTGTAKGKVEDALRAAAQTMTYGPMLCCLFIAARMRVEFLSDGKDQPQMWVQNCMYGVTYALMLSTLMVLLIPLITGKPVPLKQVGADVNSEVNSSTGGDSQEHSSTILLVLTITRYLILVGLYGGIAGIIYGIHTYLPPGATDVNKLPAPAPAVACTMILATTFFLTQLVIAFCRTYEEFTGTAFPTLVEVMNNAAATVEFAPMLSILFLCARMRALQHNSQPQRWAQDCMYAATYSLIVTTMVAIVIPLATGASMKKCPTTGESTVTTEGESNCLTYSLEALRYICMMGFYGGAVGVIYSIYVFEAPGGPEETLPVSPTAHCVANLTFQYFFVYGMLTLMLTLSKVTGIEMDKWRLFAAVESAKSTLALAPMLALLFVTTRMYALLITNKKGAPQAWVQDGMYMATWSLLISFVLCLLTGLAAGEVKTDEDGNVINEFSNPCLGIALTVVRYLSMLLLYGGIVLVIVGLFQMTPETANGRGSVAGVSDAVNATPVGDKPPSPGNAAADATKGF